MLYESFNKINAEALRAREQGIQKPYVQYKARAAEYTKLGFVHVGIIRKMNQNTITCHVFQDEENTFRMTNDIVDFIIMNNGLRNRCTLFVKMKSGEICDCILYDNTVE